MNYQLVTVNQAAPSIVYNVDHYDFNDHWVCFFSAEDSRNPIRLLPAHEVISVEALTATLQVQPMTAHTHTMPQYPSHSQNHNSPF